MLTELRISGLGVIDDAVAEFASGFSVLTGETGAGKTMIVTGLRLLGGGRSDPGRVRRGAERALVEGRFDLAHPTASDDIAGGSVSSGGNPDSEVAELLNEVDADLDEDGSVIAVRRVGLDGRSRARLGGRSVPVGVLARFCGPLITVHGQNDQLRLLQPEKQREAVDAHGGTETAAALHTYRTSYRAWRSSAEDLAARIGRSRELQREADLLRLGLAEIEGLDPRPGEDAELDHTIKRLTESESFREAASHGHNTLAGDETGGQPLVALLEHIRSHLEGTDDPELKEIANSVGEAVAALGDASTELGLYLAGLPDDLAGLDEAMERKQALKNLTRKYGADIDDVLKWADSARTQLTTLDTSDEALAQLTEAVETHRAATLTSGKKLTQVRKKAARDLASRVSVELAELSMGGASLGVRVEPSAGTGADLLEGATESGLDDITLVLDGPSGEVPLGKGASGGELSRVMLALEVVLAEKTSGSTLVFDEVDAGVGGRAALSIGRRLAQLAKTHQVIAVTHLAQVAAYADTHLSIIKDSSGEKAVSGVRALAPEERVTELARMLAGMENTDTGRAHAEELLEKARSEV